MPTQASYQAINSKPEPLRANDFCLDPNNPASAAPRTSDVGASEEECWRKDAKSTNELPLNADDLDEEKNGDEMR